MKIILSVDSVRFPLTGIGRYTSELASHLISSAEISDLKLFVGRRFIDKLPVLQSNPGVQHQVKSFARRSAITTAIYGVLFPLLRKQALKHCDDYLYHGTNFSLPPFSGRKVASFHDLSPFTWAQCSTPERIKLAQKECLHTLSCADALISISHYARKEIANYFNWPIKRIHAIPLACSEDFKPRDKNECLLILAKYNLEYQRYSLYVGTIEPRKNLVVLLDAYSKLPLPLRMQYPLILTGYEGWNNEAIFKRIKAAEREGWVRYLGYLPAEELPVIFSGARTFCFPSLYEGFGLPVLEAMASGVPVVCSNSSSLPEVMGDAGLMCTPEDVDGLSQLLLKANEDEEWRTDAINKGLIRAKHFSWPLCAKRTIEVYQTILQNG